MTWQHLWTRSSHTPPGSTTTAPPRGGGGRCGVRTSAASTGAGMETGSWAAGGQMGVVRPSLTRARRSRGCGGAKASGCSSGKGGTRLQGRRRGPSSTRAFLTAARSVTTPAGGGSSPARGAPSPAPTTRRVAGGTRAPRPSQAPSASSHPHSTAPVMPASSSAVAQTLPRRFARLLWPCLRSRPWSSSRAPRPPPGSFAG
mmetsp:Transcript_66288/g.209553  ORF Transcript_66288/g.209553 Transcript_66288/m.209553 type:complete len:201 (+) Transcript_66288:1015-1617(+)